MVSYYQSFLLFGKQCELVSQVEEDRMSHELRANANETRKIQNSARIIADNSLLKDHKECPFACGREFLQLRNDEVSQY